MAVLLPTLSIIIAGGLVLSQKPVKLKVKLIAHIKT